MTADWVATVALGNLASSQLGDSEYCSPGRNNNLQAFWAPFLLLHLGGPDTITAYALEDNELWLRHFLGLVVQVGVAFYVFLRSWSNSAIMFINIPMFISGIIKYGERNFVLRSSSTQYFSNSLPQRPDPCQEFVTVRGEFAAGSLEESPERSPLLFRFKYIFANLLLDDKERQCIYSTITDKNAVDAFKMVAVELGFMYDVFYTKAAIVYSQLGIFLRCISFVCSLSALVVFSIIIDVHAYSLTDISITYLLLVGGVLIEIYAFLLLLFSDWTNIWLIKLKKETSKTLVEHFWRFISPLLSNRMRWSGSIGQYNLISTCLRKVQPAYFGVQKLPFVGETLVIWHIATDLLYYDDLDIHEGDVSKLDPKCKVSKYLSDYMLYLPEFCPFMLQQGFGLLRYKEACAKAIDHFQEKRLDDIPNEGNARKELLEKYPKQSIKTGVSFGLMLMGENQSLLMYGCRLSMQFQELADIHRQRKWEVVCDVWAEMMAFAAHNCGWKGHVQQLREGGELLTHGFLVMAHFGLIKQNTGHKLMKFTSPSLEEGSKDFLEGYVEMQREREGNIP
ncbi:hypothetical protein Dsin_014301 [Dipteronia sinensis]|uniref:DUF4220 domain-containing protein n=1 Tax=Dipteronia sinensis TaxID=43782 RepID=A0AAE0ALI3_9ROSI|nr:hypothetical protein Dsin_014301 [Dipteronia sinensis]